MNRLRPIHFFLLSFLLLFAPAMLDAAVPAANNAPLSLEDAVRIGLEKSRTLEIARLDKDMANEKIRETWSTVLPHISADLNYTRALKPSILFFPIGALTGGDPTAFFPIKISADNAATASLDLRQPLFDASAFAGIRAAGIVRKMSDEAYRNAEASVITDIKMAYFEALITRDHLKLIEQSMARWEEARKDTKAMFRQGVAADIDTLKAYLSVENLRPDLLQSQNRVGITMTRLKNAMGVPADTTITLAGQIEPSSLSYPTDIAMAYREALEQRPDLRQLELQVQAQGEKVSSARAEHYPVISAFGKLESQTAFNDNVSLSSTTWPVSSSVGLQLSVPIFTGFRISSKVEQAKIEQLQTRIRVEDLKANIRAEVENIISTYRTSQKRIEVQSKTISVAERSYKISQLRFREGIGSRLELMDAELQLNDAKTNYLKAIYDYLLASVQLDKALGRAKAVAPDKG
jgi:outer membrane protein